MKTLIIIPAYNEELTIGSVVALSKKYGDVLGRITLHKQSSLSGYRPIGG